MEKKPAEDFKQVREDLKCLVNFSRRHEDICEKQRTMIRELKQKLVNLKQENKILKERSENVFVE